MVPLLTTGRSSESLFQFLADLLDELLSVKGKSSTGNAWSKLLHGKLRGNFSHCMVKFTVV